MKIKRVSPLSLAKITGVLLAAFGFFSGLFMIGFAFGNLNNVNAAERIFVFLFAIVGAPLIYGACGFIMGFVQAELFNFVAKRIGGLEIEVE